MTNAYIYQKKILRWKMLNYKLISKILILICALQFSNLEAQTNLSLEKCKELAIKNNTKLKNADLEIEISNNIKESAFTKYFPSIEGTGLVMQSAKDLFEMTIKGGNLPVYDGNPMNILTAKTFAYMPTTTISMLDYLYMGGFNFSQPIYAGGRIVNGNRLAELGIDASKDKKNIVKTELHQKSEDQYWQIYSLYEKVKTMDSYTKLLDNLHKDASIAQSAGLITKNDVLKIGIKQNEIKISRLKITNNIELALMGYCQFLGIPYQKDMILSDSLSQDSSPEKYYINHNEALKNRTEYKLLQKSIKAEEIQTDIKRGEYLPEIGIGASAVYVDVMDNSKTNIIAFGKLTIPITGWWDANYSMQERQLKEQIANNNAKENSELMLVQMQKAWNELNETYKQIELSELSIKQAQENLKEYNDNYTNGIINISDLLQAQSLLQDSKDNLLEIKTNYRKKIVNYLTVTGR